MEIKYKSAAIKAISKLDKKLKSQIIEAINALPKSPTKGPRIARIEGMTGIYRIRVRDYRVIYSVDENVLLITIVKIASRGAVYKNL